MFRSVSLGQTPNNDLQIQIIFLRNNLFIFASVKKTDYAIRIRKTDC